MGTLAFSDMVSPELEANPNLLLENPSLLAPGLPYAIALMTILGIHELGHYVMARRYKIKATLPYFIPVPFFLGTFGAFIQIRSPIPNRKALFDVGIAGPLAGLVATLPIFLWGLSLSDVIAASENTSMFNFDSLNPKATVLLAILSKIALGNQLTGDTALNLHPVAVAGFLGLVITALNLIPVGQLDGGHVVHAMFGQRTAIAIGQISRLLVLILAFLHQEFLWWAIFLLLMPIADEPALNDVTELDNGRDFLGLLALVILVMIVLPAPPTLIQWFYG
jgi:membrane-associated protease RseP (regulator of RpoE activity)